MASPRVLVVEPDPSRAAALEEMLRPSISYELEVLNGKVYEISSVRAAE